MHFITSGRKQYHCGQSWSTLQASGNVETKRTIKECYWNQKFYIQDKEETMIKIFTVDFSYNKK